jgi:hypothetical protein
MLVSTESESPGTKRMLMEVAIATAAQSIK